MGKMHKLTAESPAESSMSAGPLTAPSSAFDTALTSLFAASSGPVAAPRAGSTSNRQNSATSQRDIASLTKDSKAGQENGVPRPHSSTPESLLDNESIASADSGTKEDALPWPSKKRRRIGPADDIEGAYMRRLANQDVRTQSNTHLDSRPAPSSLTDAFGLQKLSQQDTSEASKASGNEQIPQHESLTGILAGDASEKSDRTVFLGNVSIEAIKSKSARKTLLNHLSSYLTTLQSAGIPHKIESLRFRSTAFASGAGPKRATYAKKELMEETTHSTHAYVVYTIQAAAKQAATMLNGTIVLDRHLRTDLVAHPAEIDHKRCVFVGNLGFVDDEMVETEAESGTKERKRRGKQPADTEEGLWRTFSKAGKIESVRVVRDKSTRIGKGIAYVQFHDENSVEAALLYNDKKFPPLLPRKLRVTRARRPKKESKPPSAVQHRGKHSRISGGARNSRKTKRVLPTEGERNGQSIKAKGFVFEGHRATKPAARVAKGAVKKRKPAAIPTTRSSRRGAAFKAVGGKRQEK